MLLDLSLLDNFQNPDQVDLESFFNSIYKLIDDEFLANLPIQKLKWLLNGCKLKPILTKSDDSEPSYSNIKKDKDYFYFGFNMINKFIETDQSCDDFTNNEILPITRN